RSPDLLTVDDPAAVVARRPCRERGEVGSCTGLAEQLAPRDLSPERGGDPPFLLLVGAVDHQRRQRPRADAPGGPPHLRPPDLVVDDELLAGAGVTTPRFGPRRGEIPRVGEAAPLLGRVERLHVGGERTALVTQGLGFRGQVPREPAAGTAARGLRGAHAPRRGGTDQLTSRGRTFEVQVRVVLPPHPHAP